MLSVIPSGLDEILVTFGNPSATGFERDNIVTFDLPYPLTYGTTTVHRTRCHHLVVENFRGAFVAIQNAGLEDEARHYGGIYNQRPIRGYPAHPSTHSWGIAIDLEPARFPLGCAKRLPAAVIEIFRRFGFTYGGDFKSRLDPMHFQLCSNY